MVVLCPLLHHFSPHSLLLELHCAHRLPSSIVMPVHSVLQCVCAEYILMLTYKQRCSVQGISYHYSYLYLHSFRSGHCVNCGWSRAAGNSQFPGGSWKWIHHQGDVARSCCVVTKGHSASMEIL